MINKKTHRPLIPVKSHDSCCRCCQRSHIQPPSSHQMEQSNRIDLHLARMPLSNLDIGILACDINHIYTKCLQKLSEVERETGPQLNSGNPSAFKTTTQIHKSHQIISNPQVASNTEIRFDLASQIVGWMHPEHEIQPPGWDTAWSASDPFQQWPSPDSLPHRWKNTQSLVENVEAMLTLEDIVIKIVITYMSLFKGSNLIKEVVGTNLKYVTERYLMWDPSV